MVEVIFGARVIPSNISSIKVISSNIFDNKAIQVMLLVSPSSLGE